MYALWHFHFIATFHSIHLGCHIKVIAISIYKYKERQKKYLFYILFILSFY